MTPKELFAARVLAVISMTLEENPQDSQMLALCGWLGTVVHGMRFEGEDAFEFNELMLNAARYIAYKYLLENGDSPELEMMQKASTN